MLFIRDTPLNIERLNVKGWKETHRMLRESWRRLIAEKVESRQEVL